MTRRPESTGASIACPQARGSFDGSSRVTGSEGRWMECGGCMHPNCALTIQIHPSLCRVTAGVPPTTSSHRTACFPAERARIDVI